MDYSYDRTPETKTAGSVGSWGGAVVGWMSQLLSNILRNLPRDWRSGSSSVSKLGSNGWFTHIEGYTSADLGVRIQLAVFWKKDRVFITADSQVVGRGQENLVKMELGFDEDPGPISRVLNQYLERL